MAIFFFLGVATILPDPSIVGKFGALLGKWNQTWFGYFSFFYPFFLVIPSFLFYKESVLSERRIGIILASIILFLALLMTQAIVVKSSYQGYLGHFIVELLIGSIGIIGVWLFTFAMFTLSITLLVESSINDFLAFIKPIINGTGFDFKEVQVSEEKRLDVVITYNSFKYIIEMKIWRGLKYHETGLKQLCDYLDIHGLDKGYLVIFNFNKNKEFAPFFFENCSTSFFE